jgi:hypothetical protein
MDMAEPLKSRCQKGFKGAWTVSARLKLPWTAVAMSHSSNLFGAERPK